MPNQLKFRLDEIMRERGLKIRTFSREHGLNFVTVSRIYHNQTQGITLGLVSRLCAALGIQPGELFR